MDPTRGHIYWLLLKFSYEISLRVGGLTTRIRYSSRSGLLIYTSRRIRSNYIRMCALLCTIYAMDYTWSDQPKPFVFIYSILNVRVSGGFLFINHDLIYLKLRGIFMNLYMCLINTWCNVEEKTPAWTTLNNCLWCCSISTAFFVHSFTELTINAYYANYIWPHTVQN